MKNLYNVYILIILTWKGCTEGRSEEWRHLSGKLNAGCPGPMLEEAAASEDADCPGRAEARWPDKLPDTDYAPLQHYDLLAKMSGRKKPISQATDDKKLSKREARLPANFLLRLPEPSRNRRHSRHKVRRASQVKRRKKRKRRQPPILAQNEVEKCTSAGPPNVVNPAPPHEVITSTNGEVAVGEPNADRDKGYQANNGESNQDTRQVVFTVLACLMALAASALLLLYLYKRSRKKSHFDSFFCPPEIGVCGDNPGEEEEEEEIDRCTCCSSSRGNEKQAAAERLSRRSSRRSIPPQQQQQGAKTKRVKATKKTRKKVAREKLAPKFSEAQLKLIQSRIACILRNECTDCQCCKCHADEDIEQPKRSRFKLFRKKQKRAMCNDRRCDENKIKCLLDLCCTTSAEDSRNPNSVLFEDNPCGGKSASRGKKSGIRIRP